MSATPPLPAARVHSPLTLAVALFPGTLFAGLAGGIAFPILPIVGVRAGLSLPFIGLILAANRAVRVLTNPLIGALTDRIGGRRTMLAGLALHIVVMGLYTLGIVTHHVGPLFLAGRLVHGLGSACVFISAQALALQAGGTGHGGGTVGTVRAAMVLGIPVGLTVGGLLSDRVGDAATFELAGLGVVIALAIAWSSVPDLRAPVSRRAPLRETVRAMSDRRLLAIGGLNFALSFAAGGMVLTTIALLVHSRHVSVFARNEQATAGILMGWMTVLDAAATPIAGRLGDRWHAHARVATAAMATLVPGLLVVGLSESAWGIAAGLAVIGVGTAGLGPSLLVLMGAIVPRDRQGTGTGLLQLCGDVGAMLGPLVGTVLFAGNVSVPYVGTAALVACFVPAGLWLAGIERRELRTPRRT